MKKTILILILLVVQSSFSQIIITAAQGVVSSKKAVVVPKTNVTIGTQVWTTKNLNVATYSDGTVIPQVTVPEDWASLTTGAWCYYNNDSANGAIYGKLYNWYAVAGIHDEASITDASKRKKLAPTGFHVPTDIEWTALTDFLDVADSAINTFPFPNNISGGAMKETGIKHWLYPNTGATNSSGFTGLSGGYSETGFFNKINENGYFWSSSENQTTDAWYRTLFFQNGYIYRAFVLKQDGFSVRLIKNMVPSAPTSTVATAGFEQASVAFTVPASDGGSAVMEYTVTSSPASSPATFTGTTSPVVVAGLTNGIYYTFTVVATNAVGNSVPSAVSLGVTPAISVPSASTSPVATAGDAEASVAFTAPASDGGSAITEYTVTSSPGGSTATGANSPLVVSGLSNGTAYTFTVVVTNAVGNSVASGTSNGVTPLSNVTIGSQVCTNTNLNVTTYRNGDVIPQVTPSALTALTTGAWCYYSNNSANGVIYGKLYNWYAVNDPRGLAPMGWHIPTDSEWTTLTDNLGGLTIAGGAMKETGTAHWASPNTGATNISGFSGTAGGYNIASLGISGFYWSSSESYSGSVWIRNLQYDYVGVYRTSEVKNYGFSVRCLRNAASFTVSDAPTSPIATAGNAQASVAFTAPEYNGGSAITEYTVTSSPDGLIATGTTSPLIVTKLTNGTSNTFTVIATNEVGNSVASEASNAVTPAGAGVCSANVGGTTKTFMCYNLGVTGTQDALTYQGGNNNGALYQWGRQTDGHEVRTSETQAGPVAGAVASKFITNNTFPKDWITPQDGTLWLDASKTANDPCPAGFRVPTQAQWGGLFRDGTPNGAPNTATRNTWTWTGNGYTVGPNLYLPAAGIRYVNDATLDYVGTLGTYWSSSVNGTNAYNLTFNSGTVSPGSSSYRGFGFSVRCISE